jgi:hypothetical protein
VLSEQLYYKDTTQYKLHLQRLPFTARELLHQLQVDYMLEGIESNKPYITIFRHPYEEEKQGNWFAANYGVFTDDQAAAVVNIFRNYFADTGLILKLSPDGTATFDGQQFLLCFDILSANTLEI